MSLSAESIARFLDETLRTDAVRDASNNGLQIANDGTVSHVAVGVDASLRFLREAAKQGADFVICHHGISWGDSLKRITGLNYDLVSFAVRHNIALYASHLPLDAHPRYGNNAQLCKALGLTRIKPAFDYHGETIGFAGALPKPVPFESFCATVAEEVSADARSVAFGKAIVRTVGIVSGGAADMVEQAGALGLDVFLTGEPSLQGYNQAENHGMNAVFAGHYATETFGIRALAKLVAQKFRLPATFIDFGIRF
ncbi:MAG: Nif3-like dinuclear metal center hexameric protein [Kiritimatiellaeota bacterium]|nr:Nif3-like dinuclear metal center hexameric protein [Kiritimatiellota bacterium]